MINAEKPLVSIVIPAYNVASTVIETLESIVGQSYDNIETIIVDDGSTDATLNLIQEFVKYKQGIQVYSKNNEGLAATRNYGFQFVKGKYLLFLDADDLIDSRFVELCVDAFISHPAVDIVTTQVKHFERINNIYIPPSFTPDMILRMNCFVITSMIKSEAFKEIGMFDTTLKFHEDWDMWIRMTEKYHHVFRIEKPLFFYRKRESMDSLCDYNDRENVSDEAHLYIYQKHYKRFSTYGYSLSKIFEAIRTAENYKRKYNGIWYRKLFYKFLKKRKFD